MPRTECRPLSSTNLKVQHKLFEYSAKGRGRCRSVHSNVCQHLHGWEADGSLASHENTPHFMEPDNSSPRSQQPATYTHPEPDQSSSRSPADFFNIWYHLFRNVILPTVLSGCETWCVISREEHRLRLFEDMVLRKIVGFEEEEVTRDWRKLHDEELHDLYCSQDITGMSRSWSMTWEEVGSGGKKPGFRWGNLKSGYLENQNVSGRIILKYILNKSLWRTCTVLYWIGSG